MTLYRMGVIAGLAALCASSALAQKQNVFGFVKKRSAMVADARLHELKPLAIAQTDKFGNLASGWIPMVLDNNWPGGPWSTVFDCVEMSPVTGTAPNGAPYENPAYGPLYMVPPNFGLTTPLPAARFRAAPTYSNTFYTNDMEINPLFAGFDTQRLAFLIYWNPVVATENMIINVTTAEAFADTEAGLPPLTGTQNNSWGGAFPGVSLNFGNNNGAGIPAGGYYFNIDVSAGATPLKFPMPADGKGAYIVQILQSTTPPTLASRAQPYFWIAKQANHGVPGGNPSASGKFEWDDDADPANPTANLSNGIHQTNPPFAAAAVEFYDYSAPATPAPITEQFGATMGFYSSFGAFTAQSAGDMTVTGGLLLGGNYQSLRAIDGDQAQVLNDEINTNSTLTMTAHSGVATTTALSVMARTSATRPDISEFLEGFKPGTNSWTQLNFRTAPVAPSGVRVDLTTGAADYLAANGDVKVRLTWIPQQDIDAGDGWSQSVDRLTVFVKGAQSQ